MRADELVALFGVHVVAFWLFEREATHHRAAGMRLEDDLEEVVLYHRGPPPPTTPFGDYHANDSVGEREAYIDPTDNVTIFRDGEDGRWRGYVIDPPYETTTGSPSAEGVIREFARKVPGKRFRIDHGRRWVWRPDARNAFVSPTPQWKAGKTFSLHGELPGLYLADA